MIAAAGAVAVLAAGCGSGSTPPSGARGNTARGKMLIEYYGCGACHRIAGVFPGGRVGPSLVGYANKRQIAGKLPNTVGNLVRWIHDPQAVVPGNLMPNLGIGLRGAKDIAAYLYAH